MWRRFCQEKEIIAVNMWYVLALAANVFERFSVACDAALLQSLGLVLMTFTGNSNNIFFQSSFFMNAL